MDIQAPETPRQRFMRNHEENVRLMRIAAAKAEREGRQDDADRIAMIAGAWEGIGDKAKAEEGDEP